MGARDSDDDIRKYLPDLKAIRRAADPAYSDKMLQEALDNPELDAALVEMKQGASPSAPPGGSAPPTPEGSAEPQPSAPSPWTKGVLPSGDRIDQSALPSAAAPNAGAAVAGRPRSPAAERTPARGRRRGLPKWLVAVLAVLAVLGPATMVAIVMKTPKGPEAGPDATTARATAPLLVSAAPSESVRPPPAAVSAAPSAVPSGTALVPPSKEVPGVKPREPAVPPPPGAGTGKSLRPELF